MTAIPYFSHLPESHIFNYFYIKLKLWQKNIFNPLIKEGAYSQLGTTGQELLNSTWNYHEFFSNESMFWTIL